MTELTIMTTTLVISNNSLYHKKSYFNTIPSYQSTHPNSRVVSESWVGSTSLHLFIFVSCILKQFFVATSLKEGSAPLMPNTKGVVSDKKNYLREGFEKKKDWEFPTVQRPPSPQNLKKDPFFKFFYMTYNHSISRIFGSWNIQLKISIFKRISLLCWCWGLTYPL